MNTQHCPCWEGQPFSPCCLNFPGLLPQGKGAGCAVSFLFLSQTPPSAQLLLSPWSWSRGLGGEEGRKAGTFPVDRYCSKVATRAPGLADVRSRLLSRGRCHGLSKAPLGPTRSLAPDAGSVLPRTWFSKCPLHADAPCWISMQPLWARLKVDSAQFSLPPAPGGSPEDSASLVPKKPPECGSLSPWLCRGSRCFSGLMPLKFHRQDPSQPPGPPELQGTLSGPPSGASL